MVTVKINRKFFSTCQYNCAKSRFDLAIVGQAQPDVSSVEQIIGETTLFESGRPVIMVPYIQKAPFKTDNVMICWDGSRTAARAVADAMPIIGKTGRVEIVIGGPPLGASASWDRSYSLLPK